MKKFWATLLVLVTITVCAATGLLVACSPQEPQDEPTYVFSFSGSGTIGGKDYTFRLNGVEADHEFFIETVGEEFEYLWGEWKFTEGKGYILTFDDAYWTTKKVKYDATTNEFYFTYEMNLGSAVGKTKVVFRGGAGDFAYDGEGWGFEPFEFSATGVDVFGMTTADIILTCYEDLTFSCVGSCPLIAVPSRSGTYSYDKDTNAYTFVFNDSSDPVVSTYDESTNTYSLSVTMNVGMNIPFTIMYTPE